MRGAQSKWRDDPRLPAIRDLWENHPEISAAEIGKRFGLSKSTIIGIAQRNDFEPRGELKVGVSPPQADPFAGLGPNDCRYPLGNLGQPGFHFCGAPAASERPYCVAHCKVSYVTVSRAAALSAAWTDQRRQEARQAAIKRMRTA